MKRAISLFVPLMVLAAPGIALYQWPDAVREIMGEKNTVWAAVLSRIPYFLAAITGVFAWRFNQIRVTLLAILLTGIYSAAEWRGPVSPDAWTIPAILLCFSYSALFWLKESRLVSISMLFKIALVGVQWAIVFGLKPFTGAAVRTTVQNHHLLQWCLPGTPISGNVVAAYLLAVACLMLGRNATRRALKVGFATSLAAALLALQPHLIGEAGGILFFFAALLLLLYSVYSLSWGRAYTDELTGLANRRAMEEALERLGRRFAIAMVDIDHFKRVNDQYGHRIGDEVLAYVAGRIRKGHVGRAYRYGGEEFAILCSKKTEEGALPALESLRKAIQDSKFVLRSKRRNKKMRGKGSDEPRKSLRVTVSIGIAQRSPKASRPELVIQSADKALYQAKKGGRNRTVCASATKTKKRKG